MAAKKILVVVTGTAKYPNLDRATGESILDAIVALRAQLNQAIVMVTHDERVAARADRIVRLQDADHDPCAGSDEAPHAFRIGGAAFHDDEIIGRR